MSGNSISILFEGSFLGWGELEPEIKTGVYHYTNSLFRALLSSQQIHPWPVTYRSPKMHSALEQLIAKESWRKPQPPAQLFYSSFEAIPDAIRSQNLPVVLTIHDLIPFQFEEGEGFGRGTIQAIDSLQPHDRIHVVSHHVRDQVISFLGHNPDLVTVIPQGIRALPPSSFTRSYPYLLSVSRQDKRKNFPRLVRAFVNACEQDPSFPCHLVICGAQRWGTAELYDELDRQLYFHNRIHIFEDISDEEISGLYRGAFAFVAASIMEGFGLPALEAMSVGTPVLASNTSCFPEVYGDAALYFDPLNEEEMAHQILHLYQHPDLVHDLRNKGLAQAQLYSWERLLPRYIDLFKVPV